MPDSPHKAPLYFSKESGLQRITPIQNIKDGERLFIVENRKKAARIQSIFPDDEVISTEGIPFEIIFSTPKSKTESLDYKIGLHPEKGIPLAAEINKKAPLAKFIILLTDTSSRGEAIATAVLQTFPILEGKTTRIKTRSLERKTIQACVEREGKLPPDKWSQPNYLRSEGYWIRAVMDITWRRKVSAWVGEAARLVQIYHNPQNPKQPESLTRLQCSILHLLQNHESTLLNYRGFKYWEVKTLLMGNTPGSSIEAAIAVPNLSILEEESIPLASKIWKEKMEKNLKGTRNGTSIPQPEPGQPWRFETENEASLYRHNIRRYPLFILEYSESWEEEIAPPAPHSTSSILEKAHLLNWGKQKEVAEALKDLYLAGLITHPKTGSNNLSDESFDKLWKFAVNADMKLCRERRKFPKEIPGQEAIIPTTWDKTPPTTKGEISRATKPLRVALAERIYQEIYEQSIKSQLLKTSKKVFQIWVTGPLPSTAADAFRGEPIQKESPLKSLMNVVLSGKIEGIVRENPLLHLKKQSLMQAVKTVVVEKETSVPPSFTREELLLEMQKESLGKLETLMALIPKMEEYGLLEEKNDRILLTPAGKTTINLLNEYLGNFIHQKYHEVVESQLKEIEKGKTNPKNFLQYWWKSLCEAADNLPPIPEAIADSSGKTLKEIETRLYPQKDGQDLNLPHSA